MKIAVLAVQGAFIEHEKAGWEPSVSNCEKKKPEEDFDGLVLPGGGVRFRKAVKKNLACFDALKEKIEAGCWYLPLCRTDPSGKRPY